MKIHNRFYVALLALLVTIALSVAIRADSGEPYPGAVSRVATYVFYPATAVTGSTTIYSSSPQLSNSQDFTRVSNWNSADVYVTGQVASSQRFTVTAQTSPDQATWANAAFLASGFTSAGVSVSASKVYSAVISVSSDVKLLRIPISGEYLRFKIEKSGAVTPTITVTLRNQ